MLPQSIRRVQRLAQQRIRPVTISQLLERSAAVSEAEHIQHAAWLREELPVRVAHRLSDFLHLPFVVVCNARFHEVFRLFLHAFDTLQATPPIQTAEAVAAFSKTLRTLVRGHAEIVHVLQEGHGELQAMLDEPVDLDGFLNQTFKTRIGNRVLAEHFLAVHEARSAGRANQCTGVVQERCSPANMVTRLGRSLGALCTELYGLSPRVKLEGQVETELSFVPEHLGFMLQELLKNALRATIERHGSSNSALPPVCVEIMKGSFDVTIKISDRGGGMRPEQLARIWSYGYTTSGSPSDAGTFSELCGQDVASLRQLAGYGFGLPLSRVYAQYFGGDIMVRSVGGFGTDAYLNINHLGDVGDSGVAAQRLRLVAS